ncbi:MAG: hypothetical protein JWR58_6979, partial [Pseudonocardia sp.]|nr:hypothetical protein [Pseudonocardia sp.]
IDAVVTERGVVEPKVRADMKAVHHAAVHHNH